MRRTIERVLYNQAGGANIAGDKFFYDQPLGRTAAAPAAVVRDRLLSDEPGAFLGAGAGHGVRAERQLALLAGWRAGSTRSSAWYAKLDSTCPIPAARTPITCDKAATFTIKAPASLERRGDRRHDMKEQEHDLHDNEHGAGWVPFEHNTSRPTAS